MMRTSLALAIGILTVATACRSTDSAGGTNLPDAGAFDKGALLQAFGTCAVDNYKDFQGKADALAASLDAWASDASKQPEVQAAWRTAMTQWQVSEGFIFGPLAMNSSPGGKELRDALYAWPRSSRCAVEQALAQKLYEDPNFPVISFANTRSLATLEYLVFYTGTDNACPTDNPINVAGAGPAKWANISADELGSRKRAYAKIVGADLRARALGLVTAWTSPGDNFLQQFVTAGRGSTVYAREQMAFNAASDALTLLSLDLKNMKVGKPIGIVGCTTGTCPEAIEHPFAKTSAESIRANLLGMRKTLVGCTDQSGALGFDDLLRAVGATDFAAKLEGHLKDAESAASAVPSLETALTQDPERVRTLYAALKELEVDLKTDFVTILNLELPKVVEGDND